MSLSRLHLRSLTKMVLDNNEQPPYPTLALDQVYDTRLEALQNVDDERLGEILDRGDEFPSIMVYTDRDKRQLVDRGSGRGAYMRHVDLIIEMVVCKAVRLNPDNANDNSYKFDMVQTDPELEGLLDLLEWEVEQALMAKTPLALKWQKAIKSADFESRPHRDIQQGTARAHRVLKIECEVHQDCSPNYVFSSDAPVITVPSGPMLDIPYLGDLERAMEDNPEVFAGTRERVYAALNSLPIGNIPTVTRLDMKADVIDPIVDPQRLPAGQTKGPDGRIEYQQSIELKGDDE